MDSCNILQVGGAIMEPDWGLIRFVRWNMWFVECGNIWGYIILSNAG